MDKLVKYQPSNLPSLKEVIQSDELTIFSLKKEDEYRVFEFLDALLIEFCSIYKFDGSKIMSESERMQCTDIILEEYKYLKESDFKLFMRKCKMGQYGKPFGSVDMPFFFNALKEYVDNRVQLAESINQVKAIEYKKEPISDTTKSMLNEFYLKQEEKNRLKYNFSSSIKKQDDVQKLVNEWMQDFKKLTGEVTFKGFVNIDGRNLGINEYLEYRKSEYENL